MAYRRRNPARRDGLRLASWAQVEEYASARGATFPSNIALHAQDAIAFNAALAALMDAHTPDTMRMKPGNLKDVGEWRAELQSYVVAAGRLRHNPAAAGTISGVMQSVALLVMADCKDLQEFTYRWLALASFLIAQLDTIEQRYTASWIHNLQALLQQAQVVQIPSTAGMLNLGGGGGGNLGVTRGPVPYPPVGGQPNTATTGDVIKGAVELGTAGAAVGGVWGGVIGGILGGAYTWTTGSTPGQTAGVEAADALKKPTPTETPATEQAPLPGFGPEVRQ